MGQIYQHSFNADKTGADKTGADKNAAGKCKDVPVNDRKCCDKRGCGQKKDGTCYKKGGGFKRSDQCDSTKAELEKKCKSVPDDDQKCCDIPGCAQKEEKEDLKCVPYTKFKTWTNKCPDKVAEKCKSVPDDDQKCCDTRGCGQKKEGGVLKCLKKGFWSNECPKATDDEATDDEATGMTEINKFDEGSDERSDEESAEESAELKDGSDRIGTAVNGEVFNPWGAPTGSSTKSPSVGDAKPLPNIGYLGSGYDFIAGNPEGDTHSLLDPGYRSPVIQLTWDKTVKHTTADQRYLVPTKSYGVGRVACQHATTATKVSSMSDYTESMQSDVSQDSSGSAGYSGFGFSVSVEVQSSSSESKQDFAQNVATTNTDRFDVKSYCVQHRVVLEHPYRELAITDYFNQRVKKLPRWNVVAVDDCKKRLCATLFFPETELYLAVKKDSSLVLQEELPKGKWLFGEDDLLFWLSGDNDTWEVDDSTKVLTRVGKGSAGKLAMKRRHNENLRRAQWTYTDNKILSVEEMGGKGSAVGEGSAVGYKNIARGGGTQPPLSPSRLQVQQRSFKIILSPRTCNPGSGFTRSLGLTS